MAQLSLRGWPLGNLPMFQRVYGQHIVNLVEFVFFPSLLVVGCKGRRGGPGRNGK